MAVSKRIRYEVLRRDGHRCRYCGVSADEGAALTVDHVIPVALGGGDKPDNLVAACKDCNAGKSSAAPDAEHVAQVSADAMRWRGAMFLAGADLEHRISLATNYRTRFSREWERWTFGHRREPLKLPGGWSTAVDAWHAAGLPEEVLEDSIRIAMENTRVDPTAKFPYLCGIVRSRLAEIQAKAKELFDSPAGRDPRVDCEACGRPCDYARAEDCIRAHAELRGYEHAFGIYGFSDVGSQLLASVIDHGYVAMVTANEANADPGRSIWTPGKAA
jgi:hypothetical protein